MIHQAMIHGNFGNILQLLDQGNVFFFSKIQNQESILTKKNVVNMISSQNIICQTAKTNICHKWCNIYITLIISQCLILVSYLTILVQYISTSTCTTLHAPRYQRQLICSDSGYSRKSSLHHLCSNSSSIQQGPQMLMLMLMLQQFEFYYHNSYQLN